MKFLYQFFKNLLLLTYRTFFHFQVYGLENVPQSGAAVLVGNHASFMDPPAMGVNIKRHVSFVARGTLADSKIFIGIFRAFEVIAVRRGEPDSQAIRMILKRLEEGQLVGLFPEGTRSLNGELGEFAEGAVLVARRAKVPIIPLAIAGTFEALPKGRLWPRKHFVRVVYGTPLDATVGSRDEVNQELHRRIALLLEEARSKKAV